MKQLLLIVVGALTAQIGYADSAVKLLSTQCEEALALSALPDRLRADASVYVLEAEGYRKSRTRTGPFTCLVTRNHPEAIIPECYDKAGTDTILRSHIRRGEMAQQGLPDSDYVAERNETAKPPSTFGLSYMVSNYNYIFIAPMQRLVKVDAHMMYYGPHLTDADIGGSQEAGMMNTGMPFINDPGVHGMIIANVDRASDSSDVVQHCVNELPDEPAGFRG